MAEKTIVAGIVLDDTTTISFVEVCELCHISEDVLFEMMDHGLLGHRLSDFKKNELTRNHLMRVRSAARLKNDLELNTSGVVLVMELLDELHQLQDELCILQRHVEKE